MDPKPETQKPSSLTIINGKASLPVKLKSGADAVVEVKLVSFAEADKYYILLADLPAFVQFMTGKDEAFYEELSDDAVFAIDALAKEINDPRFARFLERQRATFKRLAKDRAESQSTSSSPTPLPEA